MKFQPPNNTPELPIKPISDCPSDELTLKNHEQPEVQLSATALKQSATSLALRLDPLSLVHRATLQAGIIELCTYVRT